MDGQHFARFGIGICVISLLFSGCGGGGGAGGGGSISPSVTASPASVSVSAAVNAVTPDVVQIAIITANLPSNAAYIGGRYSTQGISSADAGYNTSGAPLVDIVFKPPASLSPGTYKDQIEVQFCSDSACADAIPGTSVTIPVSYQVLPIAAAKMPSVNFSQTQVNYQGLQIDPQPPPQINIAITLANFGLEPYFTVDNGGSAIANGFAYAQSLSSGTLTINLAAPASVPAGSTTVPLKITACLDANCVTPVQGSPFTVNVTYLVGNTITVAGPHGYRLQVQTLSNRAMRPDLVHGQIYLELPVNSDGAGQIAALNPTTMTLGPPAALNANGTGAMAVSDDGQYLYVGVIDGTVQRYQIPSLLPDITIPMGNDAKGNKLYAIDIAVAPGMSRTIAVAQSDSEYTGGVNASGSVAIFDDAVQRTGTTPSSAAGAQIDYLSWGADATTLFGTSHETTGLFTMSINSQGIGAFQNQGSFPGTRMHFANALLYLDGGQIIDPATAQSNSALGTYAPLYGVLPNTSTATLFVSNTVSGPAGPPILHALDLASYTPIADLQMPNLIMGQSDWILLNNVLPAPVMVVDSGTYLVFITGGFVSP
jgi:hypothetical protein